MKLRSRGSILILALWTMAFVSFLAVTLAGKVRQNIHFFQRIDDREKARTAAEAGVKSAVDRLRVRETGAPYSLVESDSLARMAAGAINGVEFHPAIILLDGPDDEQKQVDLPAIQQKSTEIDSLRQKPTITYGIMDDARRINLNRADRFLLIKLLMAVGLTDQEAADLAGQIVDARDADDTVTATLGVGGSEESRYRSEGLNYAPKNSDFEFVSELLRVPGMTLERYARIRPYVTVYGDGAVNLNTVSREVLALLDVHPVLASKILMLRAGPDRIEATEDDVVFGSQAELESKLKTLFDLKLQESMSLRHAFARRLVTLSSNYFSVVSVATAKQSRARTLGVYGLRRGMQRWMEYS